MGSDRGRNVVLHHRRDLYTTLPHQNTLGKLYRDFKKRRTEADPILAALVVKNKMFLTWSFLPYVQALPSPPLCPSSSVHDHSWQDGRRRCRICTKREGSKSHGAVRPNHEMRHWILRALYKDTHWHRNSFGHVMPNESETSIKRNPRTLGLCSPQPYSASGWK